MDKYLEAEKELAELLGYDKINDNQGFLTGVESSQGKYGHRVELPRWCRNSEAAFELMVEHNITVEVFHKFVYASYSHSEYEQPLPHSMHNFDKSLSVRYAIVMAVIQKLKGNA